MTDRKGHNDHDSADAEGPLGESIANADDAELINMRQTWALDGDALEAVNNELEDRGLLPFCYCGHVEASHVGDPDGFPQCYGCDDNAEDDEVDSHHAFEAVE